MAAFIKSIETVTANFTSTSSLETVTTNLTKSQDETKCVPFYTMRFTSGGDDARENNSCSLEMIDNAGTPAVRMRRDGSTTAGAMTVEITVVEFGTNVTVQQGGAVSLTGTSATASITSVTQTNAFIVFSAHAVGGSDDFNDTCIQASFNSNTQIAFERRSSGAPDWEIYWYVVESDGTDFNTEYVEDSWTSAETGPTNLTLSNTVTLANAFVVSTYESAATTDDLREASINVALTGTTTLTWYRNHTGLPGTTGTLGAWVVRASSSEFDVQRFATDVDGATTTNQTITAVDLTKALVLVNQHVQFGTWAIDSTNSGLNVDDRQHAVWLTSTTNVRLQRLTDTTIDGSNNNIRFEVIEFELEASGAFTLSVDSASYTWTGTAANLEYHSVISAEGASYAWSPQDVGLNLGFIMAAAAVAYALTGQDANLEYHSVLVADAGSYLFAGADANLEYHSVLVAASESFAWTGADANLELHSVLAAAAESFAWSGQDANLEYHSALVADAGSYIWTPFAATLSHSAAEVTIGPRGFIVNTGRLMNP